MATSIDYLNFIMDQLSELDEITFRKMMGEYIIYYRGKVAGGIYDNRFLIKPVPSALQMMPEAALVKPYNGAKHMLTFDNLENSDFLKKLFESIYKELPEKRSKP